MQFFESIFDIVANFFLWFFCVPRRVVEINPKTKRKEVTYVRRNHWMTMVFFFLPFTVAVCIGFVLLAVLVFSVVLWLVPPTLFLGLLFLQVSASAWALVIYKWFIVRAPADSLLALNNFGSIQFYSDCLVFIFPGFSEVVIFPGSIQKYESPDFGQPGAITALVKLHDGAGKAGEHDAQYFKIRAKIRLNLLAPLTLLAAFYEDFQNGVRAGFSRVRGDISEILGAVVDTVLVRKNMRDVHTDLASLNREIKEGVQEKLNFIGVEVVILVIEEPRDVNPDGYLNQMSRSARGTMKSKADQDIAHAEKAANLAAAAARRASEIANANADRDIALAKQEALEAEEHNRRQEAVNAIQSLIVRLKYLSGKEREILLHLVEGAPIERVIAFLEEFPRALKPEYQGATMVNVDVGTEEGKGLANIHLPVGVAHAINMLMGRTPTS